MCWHTMRRSPIDLASPPSYWKAMKALFQREVVCLMAMTLLLGLLCSCQPGSGDPDGLPPSANIPSHDNMVDYNLIQVGDVLELFVKEDPAFNGKYQVRERGDIIIPAIGRIQLGGKSIKAAEQIVKTRLEGAQLKEASVILDRIRNTGPGPNVVGARKMLVYMTGAVQKPGQHMLTIPKDRALGVYEAILISGGMQRFADEQKVHVLRMNDKRVRQRIPVNIKLIRQGEEPDPLIGEGDVIVVPEKVFGF